MFYRWWRMEEEDRGRVWRLYGWFTALMACGSCIGAVAWAANMMNLVNFFKGHTTTVELAEKTSIFALAYSWYAVFLVTYAVEFLCMCAAQLMVLDRLSVFAAQQDEGLRTRLALAGRVVMAAVVLGNAVGLAANAAAAVHYQKAAQAMVAASAAYAAKNTNGYDDFFSLSQQEVQRSGSILSVQLFCEVAVLLLIVVAFAVVGVLSARRVSARLLDVDAASAEAATGRGLRRRMMGTTAFVFVTFVLRAAFSTMFAVANQFRVIAKSCPEPCDECHNFYLHITTWMAYTPEFQLLIVLVSSPLALLVALWGMTSKSTLQLMKSKPRELKSLKPVNNVLQK
jgi:hypothetical protein